jgi:hypothetical protein
VFHLVVNSAAFTYLLTNRRKLGKGEAVYLFISGASASFSALSAWRVHKGDRRLETAQAVTKTEIPCNVAMCKVQCENRKLCIHSPT